MNVFFRISITEQLHMSTKKTKPVLFHSCVRKHLFREQRNEAMRRILSYELFTHNFGQQIF